MHFIWKNFIIEALKFVVNWLTSNEKNKKD